jgi:hypothetical protein
VVCTEQVGSCGNTSCFCLGGARTLTIQIEVICGFLQFSRQILRYYLKMERNHFLLNALKFIKIIILKYRLKLNNLCKRCSIVK